MERHHRKDITGKTSLAQHLAKAFDAFTTDINLMEIKSPR